MLPAWGCSWVLPQIPWEGITTCTWASWQQQGKTAVPVSTPIPVCDLCPCGYLWVLCPHRYPPSLPRSDG